VRRPVAEAVEQGLVLLPELGWEVVAEGGEMVFDVVGFLPPGVVVD
jgi:hypothetical protein